jgi:hypothetical protein
MKKAVGGYSDVVRFEDGAEFAGLFKVEEDLPFARRAPRKAAYWQ